MQSVLEYSDILYNLVLVSDDKDIEKLETAFHNRPIGLMLEAVLNDQQLWFEKIEMRFVVKDKSPADWKRIYKFG